MEAEDLGGMEGVWLLLVGGGWEGRRCHVLIEGHLHKQESLGTMPMDRVETIFGVNRCWSTCRLKGVEKSLDSPKPVLDQRHVPSDGVLSVNAIPVIQWFAQTSVISLGGVVAPVTCLTGQLSSTTACPNSAGLSFYALCSLVPR